MNKAELIAAMAEKTGRNKREAELTLDAFLEVVTEALQAGDKVQLIGFGAFEVRERAARAGRNLKTGEAVEIAATKVPTFKAGKGLKDAIQ